MALSGDHSLPKDPAAAVPVSMLTSNLRPPESLCRGCIAGGSLVMYWRPSPGAWDDRAASAGPCIPVCFAACRDRQLVGCWAPNWLLTCMLG